MSPFFASGGQSVGNFSFSTGPSSEHSGLISFRTDWFDLLRGDHMTLAWSTSILNRIISGMGE